MEGGTDEPCTDLARSRLARTYTAAQVAQDRGDIPAAIGALQQCARHAIWREEYDLAATYLEEALALTDTTGLPALLAGVLGQAGHIAVICGDYPRAVRLFEQQRDLVLAASDDQVAAVASTISQFAGRPAVRPAYMERRA